MFRAGCNGLKISLRGGYDCVTLLLFVKSVFSEDIFSFLLHFFQNHSYLFIFVLRNFGVTLPMLRKGW